MSLAPVIFLGGTPGAGKSTAISLIKERRPDLSVANAGDLIRQVVGASVASGRVVVPNREAADGLQEILVREVTRLRAVATADLVIDGHFAVPTTHGPSPVSVEVFETIGCRFLVQIQVDPSVIAQRLKGRGGAKWWDGSVQQIEELSAVERSQAENVAATLHLPLLSVQDEVAAADAILRAARA